MFAFSTNNDNKIQVAITILFNKFSAQTIKKKRNYKFYLQHSCAEASFVIEWPCRFCKQNLIDKQSKKKMKNRCPSNPKYRKSPPVKLACHITLIPVPHCFSVVCFDWGCVIVKTPKSVKSTITHQILKHFAISFH